MDYYLIAIYVLIAQVILLILLLILTIFGFFYNEYKKKKADHNRRKVSKIIIDLFLHKQKLDQTNLNAFATPESILATLEKFDRYIRGESWNDIKESVINTYLISFARQYASSEDWIKRNFAARVFALFPFKKDRERLLKLVDDPAFLVSSITSIALIRLEEKDATLKVIEKMPQQHGFGYYFYRDLFIDAPKHTIDWVIDIEKESENEEIKKVCKDIQENLKLVNQI